MLSGFAKRSQASATTDENIKFRLRACITYVGAESEEWQFEDHTVDFSQETDQWQYRSLSVRYFSHTFGLLTIFQFSLQRL